MVIAAVALPALALGADRGDIRPAPAFHAHSSHPASTGPYPWSRRAAKIRRADRCWRACLANTAREFQACLRIARPSDCVPANAAADRYCLRACRLGGGPLVHLAE